MGRRYDWKGLQAAYEAGTPLAVLAQRYGLVMATLKRRCRREAWGSVQTAKDALAPAGCAGEAENAGTAPEVVCANDAEKHVYANDAAGKAGVAGGVAGAGEEALACGLARANDAEKKARAGAGAGDAETMGETERAVLSAAGEARAGTRRHEPERETLLPAGEKRLEAGTEGGVTEERAALAEAEKEAAGERGRRELFRRQREEWAQQQHLLSNALARGDLEGVKLAKLTAEVLKIRQEGERRAWELAEAYPAGENGESGTEQLSPAVSELLRRLGAPGTSGGSGEGALSSGVKAGDVPNVCQEPEKPGEGGHDQG